MLLQPILEASVIDASEAKGSVQIHAIERCTKVYPCKTSRAVKHVYPQSLFYIIIDRSSNDIFKLTRLPSQQNNAATSS